MPDLPDLPKTEVAIVALTNDFRTTNRLAKLSRDRKLADAARSYAVFLAGSPKFSHEADGRRPADRIKAAGYEACLTAENLAWMLDSRGFTTNSLAAQMVEGWKNSPGHRKNLLLQHTTETAVAIAKVSGKQKYMAVQLFGRPKRLQYRFEIVNNSGRRVAYTFAEKRLTSEPRTKVQHTACLPGNIAFDRGSGKALTFAAREGARFELSGQRGGFQINQAKMAR